MSTLNTFTKTPLGAIAYKPVQKFLHMVRRRVHPDIPIDHQIVKIRCGERCFALEVRRWNWSDRMALDQCFVQGQYDMPSGKQGAYLKAVYRKILESGKVPLIIDCGANIGASVLWFSVRYPEAHIVALEPAIANFALLQKNCFGRDVDLRMVGIGAEDGSAWLDDPAGCLSMDCRVNDRGEGNPVTILSLRSVMESKPTDRYTPFLLKIDIEGAEKSMFSGQSATFDQFPLIIMEPHDWLFPGQGTSMDFFRFHVQTGREFAVKDENVASIAFRPELAD